MINFPIDSVDGGLSQTFATVLTGMIPGKCQEKLTKVAAWF
jgi:hypothetical protein